MFGFIRPVKPELRVKEADRFQQVYCGLCHAIRARYGRFYTLFLSYDMTFFALVAGAAKADTAPPCMKRCDAHPVTKRPCAAGGCGARNGGGRERAAHLSQDSATAWRTKRAQSARWPLCCAGWESAATNGRARACRKRTRRCVQALDDLQTLEREKCASMDRAADASARMTAAVVPRTGDERERILRQMFYQIGRWIYLLDAAQDVAEDLKQDHYNPVVLRYGLRAPDITEIKQPLERTLERSLADVCMAFDLLDAQRDEGLIRNIIFLGMPVVTRQVLDGTYQTNGGRGKHGSL